MHNRLKTLRKSLKLSQAAFGSRLGVSRDVVNNIENGRVELKELMIKSICSLFAINEQWLRTGEGDMHIKTDDSLFTAFAEKYNLTTAEQEVARYCLQLTSAQRAEILNHILNIAEIIKPASVKNDDWKQRELADYAVELDAEQRAPLVYEDSDAKKNGTK